MAFKFNPFTGTFDEVGTGGGGVPDPLTLNELTVNTLLTADHIHGNLAGSVYIHVKNTDSVQLDAGTPFYITGTVGASDRVEVQKADSSDPAKGPAVGVLETTLAINGEGNGVILGEIFNFDTATPNWSTNDPLYVANGGGLTNVKPTSGYRQIIAYVGRIQASTGTLVLTGTSVDPVAGSNTQIQYNDNGGFGASTDLTWNETSKEIGINGAGIYSPSANQLAISTNGTGRLFVDASGNVGVGIANPGRSLVVDGGSGTIIAAFQSTGTGCGFGLKDATTTADNIVTLRAIGNDLLAHAGGQERARIDSSGRLLVGTSSAYASYTGTPQFQISGTGISDASAMYRCDVATQTGASILTFAKSRGSKGTHAVVSSGDFLGFLTFAGSDGTNFVAAARIDGQVDGNPGANDMPGRLVFSTTADGASSPTERMRIDKAGNCLYATPSNFAGIVAGSANGKAIGGVANSGVMWSGRDVTTAASHIIFSNPNGAVGQILTSASTTSYSTSSDYRLKENVVPLTGAADRLNQLQVHRFNFIADPDTTVDGFIAHEAQAVVPECVTGTKDEVDDEGNPVYQGIDQSKLVPLLTAALQEALAEIESLKARVTALEP